MRSASGAEHDVALDVRFPCAGHATNAHADGWQTICNRQAGSSAKIAYGGGRLRKDLSPTQRGRGHLHNAVGRHDDHMIVNFDYAAGEEVSRRADGVIYGGRLNK